MRLVDNRMLQEEAELQHKKENHSILSHIAYLLDDETADEWLEKILHILLYGIACPFTIYLFVHFFF